MKKLSKEEMKKVMGGDIEYEVELGDGKCKGTGCTTTQECKNINAGSCLDCSDGTKYCSH